MVYVTPNAVIFRVGLASLTFKKKETFHRLVSEALNHTDAWVLTTSSPSSTSSSSATSSPSQSSTTTAATGAEHSTTSASTPTTASSATPTTTTSTTPASSSTNTAAMNTPTNTPTTNTLSEGIQTALLYIKNAANNIHNNKYTRINKNNKYFISKISHSISGLKLLEIAGFREVHINNSNNTTATATTPTTSTNTDTSASGSDKGEKEVWLELSHRNSAILNFIAQVCIYAYVCIC